MLRPQTWYLAAAALLALLCCIIGGGNVLQVVLLIVSTVGSLAAIPLFNKRPVQAMLCLVPMVALLAWYVALAAGADATVLKWYHALPLLSLALLVLARKGIVHDEKVVRSYDRIR